MYTTFRVNGGKETCRTVVKGLGRIVSKSSAQRQTTARRKWYLEKLQARLLNRCKEQQRMVEIRDEKKHSALQWRVLLLVLRADGDCVAVTANARVLVS